MNSGGEDGGRVGRFVLFRDADGVSFAVSSGAILAICGCDGGSLVLLPGGRVIKLDQSLDQVLSWLESGYR